MADFWEDYEPVETEDDFDWEDLEPIQEPISQPEFPRLAPGATLSDVLQQPSPIVAPWEGGVVRSVLPGVLQPEDLRPAVRLIGGDIAEGQLGDTHPDIIERDKIPAIEIDQRGFTGPQGEFYDREAAAQGTGLPTAFEPGRLHSTDLSVFQESGGFQKQLQDIAAAEGPQPLVTLPEIPEALKQGYSLPVRALFGEKAADVEVAAANELYNAAKSVPEFLTTEEGMLSLLASMTGLGKAGVTAYFTYDMAKNLLQQAKDMGGKWDELSTEEKAKNITRAASTLGFTALLGKALVGQARGLVRPKPIPPVIEPEPAPVPEATPTTGLVPERAAEPTRIPPGESSRIIPTIPAPKEGTVRVFSGGPGSSWFSTNPKRAATFGPVNFVDVPVDVFEKAQVAAKESGSGTAGDALLPNEWVNKAVSLRDYMVKQTEAVKPTPAAPESDPVAIAKELGAKLTRPTAGKVQYQIVHPEYGTITILGDATTPLETIRGKFDAAIARFKESASTKPTSPP